MKNYRFGLNVEESTSNLEPDFDVSAKREGVVNQQYNPYGGDFFNKTQYMVSAGGEKITSIPSPYARMLITDIAFREYDAGRGVMAEDQLRQRAIPDDYVKTISHCLDIFEIMYRLSDLQLLDHDIKIELTRTVSPNTPGVANSFKSNPNLRSYLETLELFRKSYNSVIESRKQSGHDFYYDFTSNYLFKYKDRTFASTSPFTGFFTKADCDLRDENGTPVLSYAGHNYLTRTKNDWILFEGREQKFLDFLYLLLKDTGLSAIYMHLFNALKRHVDAPDLDGKKFINEFPNYNIGPDTAELPKVITAGGQTYVRPGNMDRCYLKYLLYIAKPFNFSVSFNDFNTPIADRVSPDGLRPMPWLSVNDLLSDTLVVLPYEVDKKYEAIEYFDLATLKNFRRCLVPIKQEALNYIDLENLIRGLKIKKYSTSHFCVILTLTLTTGGTMELRRDYYSPNSEKGICCYPNGVITQGADMKQFVFGIYPFAQSDDFENIYKVLFYNDFSTPNWSLRFFYHADGKVQAYPDAQVLVNKTNVIKDNDTFYPHNCTYYHVSGGDLEDRTNGNNKKIGIKFAELNLDITVPDLAGNNQTIRGTALIVPRLKHIELTDRNETVIAIDLGTSNTYMAYYHPNSNQANNASITDFSTIHGNNEGRFLELEFMHCDMNEKLLGDLAQYYQDAVLPEFDGSPSNEALSAQLSEFIPARIVNTDSERGVRFPIPSVVNRLRSENGNDGMVPLLNRSIPFAYYSIGWRRNEDKNVDIDNIAEGKFKWFYGKDESGIYGENVEKKNDFIAFMTELLFIVRCNMLCNGYDLNQCKIIWTYPLSFQDELIGNYTRQWELNFCRMFHPEWLTPNKDEILQGKTSTVKEYIKSTNESLTPFFACNKDASVHHLNMVVDMGGGSTDIIGYSNNKPQFISSFGFAGNSLYLDGELNRKVEPVNNYIVPHLKKKESVGQKGGLNHTQKINMDASVSSLMNYGFSQSNGSFQDIFINDVPKFMLQLHNAALFYHIAQVCHAMSPNELPVHIHLTGNGSKLISLNKSKDKYIRLAFREAYNVDGDVVNEIRVTPYPNPKAAAVYGALEGNKKNLLAFNDEARKNRVVAFGDDKTFNRVEIDEYGIPTGVLKSRVDDVYNNVLKFIDFFYKGYGSATPIMNKEEMIKCLKYIKGDDRNAVDGDFLTDSLFFQFISLVMEEVSARLLSK